MAKKKNKKSLEIFEKLEVEPVEGNAPETESFLDESESLVSDAIPQDGDDVESEVMGETLGDVPSEEEDNDVSNDDLLEDVRRSLIEENEKFEAEKKPSWWQRLGVGKRKEKASDDSTPVVEPQEEQEQVDLEEAAVELIAEEQEDAGESIDGLIEILATTTEEEISTEAGSVPVDIEEEQPEIEKVDLGELKKRAFRRSEPDDLDEDFNHVRAVALDGDDGEEVFVEIDVKTEDPIEERIKSFENALKPYRRYINFGIAFIGIVVIVLTSGLLYSSYQKSLPPEPTKVVSNLPHPVVLRIPGGLSFNLGRGSLEDGRWNPRNPEWLEGTEVCRWVAIRYSRQLEAVIRTLTQDDQLELVMSNSDVITYDVYSIKQMSIEDMQDISSNSPCLLLVLADATTDTRWVVTAYP